MTISYTIRFDRSSVGTRSSSKPSTRISLPNPAPDRALQEGCRQPLTSVGERLEASSESIVSPADRIGSHVNRRYVHPETDEIRNVTIPMGGEVGRDTLRNIAYQCGANDFVSWCDWSDDLLS